MLYSDLLDSLTREGDAFSAVVSDRWRQGRTLFGGLQVALAVRAMRTLVPELAALRSLHATFVAPVPSGPISLAVEVLRRGRSATQVECKLGHDARIACVVVAIFGATRPSRIEIVPPRAEPPCDPATLTDLPFVPGVTPDFARHFAFRWAEGGMPLSGATDARTKIFVRFRDPVRDSEAEMLALADSIPSPGLSLLSSPAGLSSLSWMFELLTEPRTRTSDGFWLLDTEVLAGREGYLNQTSLLSTPDGEAAALSRQTVAIFG